MTNFEEEPKEFRRAKGLEISGWAGFDFFVQFSQSLNWIFDYTTKIQNTPLSYGVWMAAISYRYRHTPSGGWNVDSRPLYSEKTFWFLNMTLRIYYLIFKWPIAHRWILFWRSNILREIWFGIRKSHFRNSTILLRRIVQPKPHLAMKRGRPNLRIEASILQVSDDIGNSLKSSGPAPHLPVVFPSHSAQSNFRDLLPCFASLMPVMCCA